MHLGDGVDQHQNSRRSRARQPGTDELQNDGNERGLAAAPGHFSSDL